MLKPNPIQSGDTVYVLSTARYISQNTIKPFVEWVKSFGLEVLIGDTIGSKDNQYAGDEECRVKDFQNALDDPSVKAVFFAKGGYGSIRMVDKINWNSFVKNPKWLVGFSDMTVWHNHVNQFFGISSIHGLMATTFKNNTQESKDVLKDLIFGKYQDIIFTSDSQNRFTKEIEGQLIGGNLSIMYSLLGTNQGWGTNGKILFLEDLDEYLYHIDRMMKSIELAGKFKGLNGIVVGGFTDLHDNDDPFGGIASSIILEHTDKYGIPVVFGLPSGHIDNNIPLVLGAQVRISESDNQMKLSYL